MAEPDKPTDWSEERFREMLVYQRKFMWHEDTIDKLAIWLGLAHGMTVADLGCGLGYLGYTYWPYFGKGGHYVGIDQSLTLLADAQKGSEKWADGGEASFMSGDAYHIPLEDNAVDIIMCQAVLMHLKNPQEAVREMARVVRPGGTVMCHEPDNLTAMMAKRFMSLPEFSTDDLLLSFKVALLCNKGRLSLGKGDANIGVQVLHLMRLEGLTDLDARLNDRVWFLEPPYKGEEQQHRLKIARKNMLDEEHADFWYKRGKEEFLAGGGDEEEYDRYVELGKNLIPVAQQQFDAGEFYSFGSNDMYIVKGRKPE